MRPQKGDRTVSCIECPNVPMCEQSPENPAAVDRPKHAWRRAAGRRAWDRIIAILPLCAWRRASTLVQAHASCGVHGGRSGAAHFDGARLRRRRDSEILTPLQAAPIGSYASTIDF